MDAHDLPSSLGTSPTPAPPSHPSPETKARPLQGLYASPNGPSVLIYFPDHHNLAMPLVPRMMGREEPAMVPLHFRILYRTGGGELVETSVRLDPESAPPPLGDWVARTSGGWVVRVAHIG